MHARVTAGCCAFTDGLHNRHMSWQPCIMHIMHCEGVEDCSGPGNSLPAGSVSGATMRRYLEHHLGNSAAKKNKSATIKLLGAKISLTH